MAGCFWHIFSAELPAEVQFEGDMSDDLTVNREKSGFSLLQDDKRKFYDLNNELKL